MWDGGPRAHGASSVGASGWAVVNNLFMDARMSQVECMWRGPGPKRTRDIAALEADIDLRTFSICDGCLFYFPLSRRGLAVGSKRLKVLDKQN